MQDSMNDYDRVARQMQKALATLIGNMHQPRREINSNSITITKDGALSGIIQMQRAIDYCRGVAESHRQTEWDSLGAIDKRGPPLSGAAE